jgi:hypothetical protein
LDGAAGAAVLRVARGHVAGQPFEAESRLVRQADGENRRF